MSGVTDNYGLILPAKGEGYTVDIINQNNVAIDGLLLDRSKYAQGFKHINKGLSNSGGITAISVVYNVPSFAFKGGRKYEIVWDAEYVQSVANTYHRFEINTCAVADAAALTTGLTTIGGRSWSAKTAGFNESFYVRATYEPSADTTLQIKFTGKQTAGTGNAIIIGSASSPNLFTIEDKGAQF